MLLGCYLWTKQIGAGGQFDAADTSFVSAGKKKRDLNHVLLENFDVRRDNAQVWFYMMVS